MKYKSLFMSALLAFSMSACINDAEVLGPDAPDNNTPAQVGQGNVSFRFVVPNISMSSRADETGTIHSGNAEDSNGYEEGVDAEYTVHNVRLYLFSKETGNLYKTIDIDDLGQPKVEKPNVYYDSQSYMLPTGEYRVFAIANGKHLPVTASTVDNLLQEIDAATYNEGFFFLDESIKKNGIIMTNRGVAGSSSLAIVKTNEHIVPPFSITLERVVAKVRLSKAEASFPLVDNGKVYARIDPSAYAVVNLNKNYYLFRHVAQLPDGDETPAASVVDWSNMDNFGNIPSPNGYVIDPSFFKKTVAGVSSFDGSSVFVNPLAGAAGLNFSGTFGIGEYKGNFYCLENTMFRPAQLQAYTTGIIIKCNIGIEKDCLINENGDSWTGDLPGEVYYFNHKFYTSLNALHTYAKANIPASANPTDAELLKYNIKHFELKNGAGSYSCYYNYWIKHHDPNPNPTYMDVMEFGIVRNNIYDINIAGVADLGLATPNTDPETPDEPKGYLDVEFNVMPWIVRAQDAILE